MKFILAALAATLALSGCGGGGSDARSTKEASSPLASASPVASSTAADGYSKRCRVAALDWASDAEDAALGFVVGLDATDGADRLGRLENKIKVFCGEGDPLTTAVETATYDIALANAEVMTGDDVGQREVNSIEAGVKKVRRVVR